MTSTPGSVEIAKSAIQQMNAQVGLFISLSLAICGGLLILMLQTLLHNHVDTKQRIGFRYPFLLLSAFALQVISAILGLFCMGAITDAVPAIFGVQFDPKGSLMTIEFEGSQEIGLAGKGQVVLFILSLVFLICFIFCNWRLISVAGGGTKMKTHGRARRTTAIALALAIASGIAAAALARGDELTGRPAVESPSEFDKDVRSVRDRLAQLSASDPAGRDLALGNLALEVGAFLGQRILAGPLRDEQDPLFIRQLNETHGAFVLALKNFDRLNLKTLDLSEFEDVTYRALGQNFKTFANFYQQRYAATTAHLEQPEVLRTVIAFSMVVYAADRDRWRAASRRSHFWPLCSTLK